MLVTTPFALGEEGDPAWHGSLAEGKRVAEEEGKLLLVYLDPTLIEDPTIDKSEALSETALETAAEKVVVVRLEAGVEDPDSRFIRTRYDLFTTLAAGVVIDPTGARFGQVLTGSTDLLLSELREAPKRLEEYTAKVEALGTLDDTVSRYLLATLYYEHAAFEPATKLARLLSKEGDLTCEMMTWWGYGLARLRRVDEAEKVFRRVLTEYPDAPSAPMTRLWLATLQLDPARAWFLNYGIENPAVRQQGLDALHALLEDRVQAGDLRGQAMARFQLLSFLEGYADPVAHCFWIVENAPEGDAAAEAWWRLVTYAIQWNDPDMAVRLVEDLIAARSGDDEIVAYAQEYLAQLKSAVVRYDGPEFQPFALRMELPEEPAEAGSTVPLTVHLSNRDERAFNGVGIGCHVASPGRLVSRAYHTVDRLGASASVAVTFEIECPEAETVHVVITAERTDVEDPSTRIGRHVRIDVED